MELSSFKGRIMGSSLAFWCPLLHLLLLVLVMCAQGIAGRKLTEEQLETTHKLMKPMDQKIQAHHSSSHMDHMDPSHMIFFTIKDLKVGKTMPVYFPKRDPSKSPRLLPRSQADSIPFSSKQLPHLLEFFSFSKDSHQAKAMEDTIGQCEIEPIKGETKFCPTSLESMLDFTRSMLGPNTRFTAVATAHLTNSTTLFQNYTILKEPKEIFAPKMVACHSMPYPYAVFYCHSQQSVNKVYKVELGGEDGDRVDAVAVCHLDTSDWSPDHASFSVLRIKPGTSPVCHFFPADNLVWVPTSTSV
ncbi:putative BURP domain-containing protein [Rosa chinensis]|uniref:Putative BURP domain-containing protein n=1 Tax=Rosa chinensis TaxID=74649 RepID=A0A2P6PP15_ROSCH|nr:BURP domain protein USPL1 [Rosa chinensis]PRQ23668.1 putative BURP domain-containing protein [Rosa chinensis]